MDDDRNSWDRRKSISVKAAAPRTWTDLERAGELTLGMDAEAEAAFLDRRTLLRDRGRRRLRAPQADDPPLADLARNRRRGERAGSRGHRPQPVGAAGSDALSSGGTGDTASEIALGWLEQVYRGYRSKQGMVEKASVQGSIALLHGIDLKDLPKAWIVDVEILPDVLAMSLGDQDEVLCWLHRTYQKPKEMMERLSARGSGIRLALRPIGSKLTLA